MYFVVENTNCKPQTISIALFRDCSGKFLVLIFSKMLVTW